MTLARASPPSERFLASAAEVTRVLEPSSYAISGNAARCLWMLHGLSASSLDLWRRVSHPWPTEVDVVGVDPPPPARRDEGPIAREFGPAMLRSKEEVEAGPLRVPLVEPAFVLAALMSEDDLLRVARVASLLRCLERVGRSIDPEDVRHLLKAVGKGHRFGDYLDVLRVL